MEMNEELEVEVIPDRTSRRKRFLLRTFRTRGLHRSPLSTVLTHKKHRSRVPDFKVSERLVLNCLNPQNTPVCCMSNHCPYFSILFLFRQTCSLFMNHRHHGFMPETQLGIVNPASQMEYTRFLIQILR